VLNPDNSYQSESAWTTTSTNPPGGSGGGLSIHFAQPAWQTGPGVANSFSNGARQVPDVALDADPQTGYSIYATNNPPAPNPPATGWWLLGGTSAGAPSWAAFAALFNQYAASLGRGKLGFANPSLYAVATGVQPAVPYHDIVNGNNLVYQAKQGWDYPTGWGTPDVTNLVSDILVARSPLRPWLNQAAAGGTAPLQPWYKVPPHGTMRAATTPNVARATASPAVAGVPSPGTLPESVRHSAPLFMSLVADRLMTFLR
jgi:kumamolisin